MNGREERGRGAERIDRRHDFVIHAPRQIGKTTALDRCTEGSLPIFDPRTRPRPVSERTGRDELVSPAGRRVVLVRA